MKELSIIFNCHLRPELTTICLERLLNITDNYDTELIILYDGRDPEYIKMLNDISDVEYILSLRPTQERGLRGVGLNKTIDMSDGEYYSFIENDWFCNEDFMPVGKRALKEVDVIRLCLSPFYKQKVLRDGYYLMDESNPWRWTFNPSLRKEKFLAGRFLETKWKIEGDYSIKCRELGVKTAITDRDVFTHLGIYGYDSVRKKSHNRYYYGWEPLEFFKRLNPKNKHLELYTSFLERMGENNDINNNR